MAAAVEALPPVGAGPGPGLPGHDQDADHREAAVHQGLPEQTSASLSFFFIQSIEACQYTSGVYRNRIGVSSHLQDGLGELDQGLAADADEELHQGLHHQKPQRPVGLEDRQDEEGHHEEVPLHQGSGLRQTALTLRAGDGTESSERA